MIWINLDEKYREPFLISLVLQLDHNSLRPYKNGHPDLSNGIFFCD